MRATVLLLALLLALDGHAKTPPPPAGFFKTCARQLHRARLRLRAFGIKVRRRFSTLVPPKARHLQVGQSLRTEIRSWEKWNHTGVKVQPGEEYRLKVARERNWTDFYIHSPPEGYSAAWMRSVEGYRRAPKAGWFTLMGAVGKKEANAFVIGKQTTLRPREPGELTCFANDLSRMYWNNRGTVFVDVERVR
jgi:hypothetical protein